MLTLALMIGFAFVCLVIVHDRLTYHVCDAC